MYRKHIMEQKLESGSKTLDRLVEIPVLNTAMSSVGDYYGKIKEKNFLTRTSCNLAELSFRTMTFAATPVTAICKKPIDTVDSYFYEKVDALEYKFPVLSKPTEVLTNQAKDTIDKSIRLPIEQVRQMKEKKVEEMKLYSVDKANSLMKAGFDSFDQWCNYSTKTLNTILEQHFTKVLTDPILNYTEKSLDYWMPLEQDAKVNNNQRTLRRIYDINNRIFNYVYHSTFTQLAKVHHQFDMLINKVIAIRNTCQTYTKASRDQIISTIEAAKETTLIKHCLLVIEKNRLTYDKLDGMARQYYKMALTEVSQILEKYMNLVKKFPVSFKATQLRQTIENLQEKMMSKDTFHVYLGKAIENLQLIQHQLLMYTSQMFEVVNDSKIMQLLNPKSTSDSKQLQQAGKGEGAKASGH